MKTIGWCLERIQIAMSKIPRDVVFVENQRKAKQILNEVQEYADILEKIITNSKFKDYLMRLEKCSFEEIKFNAKKIEELHKDLEHMLYVLDLYIKNLNEIIIRHPEQWSEKADQRVLMIDQKFGGERGELKKEFQIYIHNKEELKEILIAEEHLVEFLK